MIKIFLLLIILCSCYNGRVNYNVGISRKETILNREKIVLRQDRYSKKQMAKARKRAGRLKYVRNKNHKSKNIIN